MGRNIVIVGGVAGGASAATRLRRNQEEDNIIMFERGPHVSFSNCSLPYHLSGVVENASDLVLMDPEDFYQRYRIDVRTGSEVIAIDRTTKEVTVKNLETDETYKQAYDKLILSPGAAPIVPKITGIDKVNVFTIRNVVDIDLLQQFIQEKKARDITVIGAGYIGVEVAENLRKAGLNVTLVEAMNQILRPFDYDMVQIFHKVLLDHQVNLILGDIVEAFDHHQVLLASGKTIAADAVVMAVGVAPETSLASKAGLELGQSKAIKVNKNYQTSDHDIYAIGDAIEVYQALSQSMTKLSLAGPALKQARSVADHINHKEALNKGYIGSSAIKLFDYNGAATGLNESTLAASDRTISYDVVRVILSDKVSLMPDAAPIHLKLLFEIPTGKILGAQAIGRGDVTKRIDTIATVIKFGGTVEDLKDLELCYAPPFSTAKDVVNYAGYVGSNLLHQDFQQVNLAKVRELVMEKAFIVDVRESLEFKRGHVKGSINIPLSEFRERMSEIPKDEPVYLMCRTGQRSYNAIKILKHNGYHQVFNIAGSFLGLSFYEYYNDQVKDQESIITKYNFL